MTSTALRTVADIETPAVLIDLDRVESNIRRVQAMADAAGIALRPHIKTHKLPYFALKQVEAGAVGITCQKLGEAEVMADAGLTDIFLPYNILGRAKLDRLHALHGRVAMSVTADSLTTVEGLASRFTDPGHPLRVLVECDTGMGRCGVQTPAEAVDLAAAIARAPGLRFGGLMTYPRPGHWREVGAWLEAAKAACDAAGLPCPTVTSGGTPDVWRAGESRVVTEYRPGNYIYFDRSQIANGSAKAEDCALTVLATVVSRPTPSRAILDAGSKSLSSDLLGLEGYGAIVGLASAGIASLSEEHANVMLAGGEDLPVGTRVRVLPNHSCVVSNLFDRVHLISGERVVEVLPVAARGHQV